jgi:Mg-chelatase subunit ChlD
MKTNTIRSMLGFTALGLGLVLGFQNCSNAKFTTEVDQSSLLASGDAGDDSSCRPTTVDANTIVKVLFVVDTSGSNAGESGQVATDPQKTWRHSALNGFISRYSSKSNFHYGLITFQNSSAKAQIRVNNVAAFSNSASVVDSGMNSFMATKDEGYTPYKAALSAAKSLIQSDINANSAQKANYVLVMVSDGQATDYKSPDDIIPDASSIKNLAPSRISLNSIYYYSNSYVETQTKYLRNLSSIGGGAFITANSNTTLNIDDVIKVPSSGCQ